MRKAYKEQDDFRPYREARTWWLIEKLNDEADVSIWEALAAAIVVGLSITYAPLTLFFLAFLCLWVSIGTLILTKGKRYNRIKQIQQELERRRHGEW